MGTGSPKIPAGGCRTAFASELAQRQRREGCRRVRMRASGSVWLPPSAREHGWERRAIKRLPILRDVTNRRPLLALLLLSAFLLGSVAAPLAHFGWMELSGRFGPPLADGSVAPDHAAHGMRAPSAHLALVSDGPGLAEAPEPVITCSYAQYLTNHAPAVLAEPVSVRAQPQPESPGFLGDAREPDSALKLWQSARGPPERA